MLWRVQYFDDPIGKVTEWRKEDDKPWGKSFRYLKSSVEKSQDALSLKKALTIQSGHSGDSISFGIIYIADSDNSPTWIFQVEMNLKIILFTSCLIKEIRKK